MSRLFSEIKPTGPITGRSRGEALYRARGSCSNCARSIEKHDVVLVVDYKIPREWGVLTEQDNLWAVCEDCRAGKKNCFKSVGAARMRYVMALKSVHMRLGETLKALKGQPAPAQMMSFVADQHDWRKRIRDLRYLGWVVQASRKKTSGGTARSFYRLVKAKPWPENPSAVVQKYERDRARRNKGGQ